MVYPQNWSFPGCPSHRLQLGKTPALGIGVELHDPDEVAEAEVALDVMLDAVLLVAVE
jgi:hypothetical protein